MIDDLAAVTVRSLSGREATFSLTLTCTVRELKGRVSDAWRLPTDCQRMLLGCNLLEDDEPLADVLHRSLSASGDVVTAGTLQLTLAVSDVGALQQLAHKDPHVRLNALRALLYSAKKGDDRVIEAVLERLVQLDAEDERASRAAAVEVLCNVAERGDTRILRCLAQRLNDQTWRADWFTRRASVVALGTLAEEGLVEHGELLQQLMQEDHDWRVRLAALEVLGAHLYPECATAVAARLQDEQWRVRHAALMVLPRVASRGDEHIVRAVCGVLKVFDERLTPAAAKALADIAPLGDVQALEALEGALKESFIGDTRDSIVMAIAKLQSKPPLICSPTGESGMQR